jgi:uncharacterized protein
VPRRPRAGADASEADLAVLERQWQRREPLTAEERRVSVRVDTTAAPSAGDLARRLGLDG